MPTSKRKLSIWNERMLLLMQHCIDMEFCESKKDFLKSINFPEGNLYQVKTGSQSFTNEQIYIACKKYKISVSWIFGFSSEMKYVKGKTALQNLKDAVRSIEAELK